MPQAEWRIAAEPPAEFINEFPEINTHLLNLLYRRNVRTAQEIEQFLQPDYSRDSLDPYLFRQMRTACDHIYQAIAAGTTITIHGDYDADGVCASTILSLTLERLGATVNCFLPHREKDGYGLNQRTIQYLHQQGTGLIITCDCGISNAAEITAAKSLGINTIITDHHQVPEELPEAVAIIHPKVPGEPYPFKELAGGGVAFKLVQGLLRHESCLLTEQEKEMQEKWLLDLVAISSIADMVSLLGETRLYVKFGLHVLRKNRRQGLKSLLEVANINPELINEQTVGYQIAPRINAAGRVDHANAALFLLREQDPDKAVQLAEALQQTNAIRQKQTDLMTAQALKQPPSDEPILFFYQADWPLGLTGLVAGKLAREYGKPCFVFGFDGEKIVGSGRGVEGVNILEPVREASALLLSYGGHPQACGLRLTPDNFLSVQSAIVDWARQKMGQQPVVTHLTIEAVLPLCDIQWSLVDSLQQCAPFGMDNPEPIFASYGVDVVSAVLVGKDSKHLKLTLRQGTKTVPAIAFSQAESLPTVGSEIDIAYTVGVNQWNGNREIQLQIISIKRHER